VMLDGVLRTEGAPRRALRVETGDFPEFPSDLLPQFMALATQAEGMSELVERIYDHRFDHAAPFRALGARLEVTGRSARVWGPAPLTGTAVHGSASANRRRWCWRPWPRTERRRSAAPPPSTAATRILPPTCARWAPTSAPSRTRSPETPAESEADTKLLNLPQGSLGEVRA
jgi:hypothetical protein